MAPNFQLDVEHDVLKCRFQAAAHADSHVRHKMSVNVALRKQKQQEAKDLMWVQEHWEEINPGAEMVEVTAEQVRVWCV